MNWRRRYGICILVLTLSLSPLTTSSKRHIKTPLSKKLKRYIRKGYIPAACSDLAPFRKVFDHLTITDDGLLMKGEKIILPEALQEIGIKKAHQGAHPGMSGMKRRLRTHFWFPKMDVVIENFVSQCKECQMFTNKRSKHTITPLCNTLN